MKGASHSRFQDLLLQYSKEADAKQRKALEEQLWTDYGAKQAVLVADMSGFSSLSSRFGIVHYLSMVRRMQLTAEPIIAALGGVVIKFEADNCFAMFDRVDEALQAAVALNDAFDTANRETPDELDIRLGCGIDCGAILVIDRGDFFGEAVNRASKLGEDLAEPGEILLTAAAVSQLADAARYPMQAFDFSVSGIRIEAHRLHRS